MLHGAVAAAAYLLVSFQLNNSVVESFSFGQAPCGKPLIRPSNHDALSASRSVASTAIDAGPEEVTLLTESGTGADGEIQRRSASRRRVSRATRRRARRLARARRDRSRQLQQEQQQQQRQQGQTKISLERDEAGGGDDEGSRLYPSPTVVVDVDGNASPVPPDINDDVGNSGRVSTIEGRPIVRGEGRSLWGSIFGPRPLRSVHSIEELSTLMDVDGWRIEDLSVITGTGPTTHGFDGKSAGGDSNPTDAAYALESKSDTHVVDHGDGDGDGNPGGEAAAAVHPLVQAVLDRGAAGTLPSLHNDGRRIGLAIEV